MVLFVLSILTLTAIGNPVKCGAPVIFYETRYQVGIGGWITKNSDRMLQLLRALLMSIGPHESLQMFWA